ncbi:DNA repair protein RecO [Candidatus Gottesmanbacteria bacterium]|nr:DNA repair protein RecO [Candidatus Gottesmanbacteria bacterium]
MRMHSPGVDVVRTYKTEGIILKRNNFGEADRILTIFTRRFGKIRARAPGIRRTTSRKAPHLELFNLATLFLAQGKNIDIVTEAQTIDNFSGVRHDLKKVSLAYYLCELVDSLCPERQENKEVFNLLTKTLKDLEASHYDNIYYHSEDFANQLLWNLGFLPREKKLVEKELEQFIENLIEKKLKSRKLLRKIEG